MSSLLKLFFSYIIFKYALSFLAVQRDKGYWVTKEELIFQLRAFERRREFISRA